MSAATDHERGFILLEVLITLVVVAIGVLGLAALQGRTHMAAVEANQRAQAIAIGNDMISRINLNRAQIDAYVTATPLGNNDSSSDVAELEDCLQLPVNDADPDERAKQRVARDRCEWANLLKGASDQAEGRNIGAMIGARGCVEVVAADPATCTPAVVRVTTVWQGLVETAAPNASLGCGSGKFGDERLRRAVATRVVIGLPSCL